LILIGIGGNLSNHHFKTPRMACGAALDLLSNTDGLSISKRSPWYETAPVPVSYQPWFINAVIAVESQMPASKLIKVLLDTEIRLGRVRENINGPRIIDLDLLCYGDQIINIPQQDHQPQLTLPHPRLHNRAFVLYPIRDIAPDWHHPVSGKTPGQYIDELGPELLKSQHINKISDETCLFGTEWPGSAQSGIS